MYALTLGENSSKGFHFFFRLVRSYSRIAVESVAVCLGMSTFAHRRRTKSIIIVSKAVVTIIILKELTLQCIVEQNLLKGLPRRNHSKIQIRLPYFYVILPNATKYTI